MKLVLLLVVACLYFVNCDKNGTQPSDPRWPDVFQQTFKETFTYPVVGSHETTGTFYYDYPNKRYRVDRANGRYDRYCGFNGIRAFQNTPCTHLVIDGMRWLIYPEKKDCCQCCTAAQGCGVLKPTWLSNAQFKGSQNGEYVWDQPGLQSNLFHERISDRVMTRIFQKPNDDQVFDADSFKSTIENADEVFKLPSYCKPGKCSLASTCRAVGK